MLSRLTWEERTIILRLHNTDVYYGAVRALKAVSLEVGAGEIVAMVGANGAGKSTTLKTISGLLRPRTGTVTWNDTNLARISIPDIVSMGISHAPEGRRIFPGLSVYENLIVGTAAHKDRRYAAKELENIYKLFPVLKQRSRQLGWSLSGGEQQMLCIGRALMAQPKLLLLDEPSLGLAPKIVSDLFRAIVEINRTGTSVLLVEQNANMALKIAHRGYVMENGKLVLQGESANLRDMDQVKKAYLGA